MRFWVRAVLIIAATVGFFIGGPRVLAALGTPPDAARLLTLFMILIAANGLAYAFLRCPHCGKWACRRPSGWTSIWPGLRCRHCGEPY